MTENKRTITISLSDIRKRHFEVWDREECFPTRLFKTEYMNLDGLPSYFLYFGNEDDDCLESGVCSNNAVDIISALNEKYDVVLVS